MRICLIGYGNMGSAMLSGWLASAAQHESPHEFTVIEPFLKPEDRELLAQHPSVHCYEKGADVPADGRLDVVVLAVKPQVMGDVLSSCQHIGGQDTVFVSIAAGLSLSVLQQYIPQSHAIIRAMPNSPAKVQMGITAIIPTAAVSAEMLNNATELLSAAGTVVRIDDETLMDAVTAVSGSGPAYVFYLVEAMAQAGEKLGLDPDTAMQLARHTVIGAGQLLHKDTLPVSQLRANVTSEGGTTAAALQVLMAENGLAPLMEKAQKAARDRGIALSSG